MWLEPALSYRQGCAGFTSFFLTLPQQAYNVYVSLVNITEVWLFDDGDVMFAAAPEAAALPEFARGQGNEATLASPEPRSFFPETWLWDLERR